ncbi:Transcriptional regulator lsrR [Raoultella terrigena]|uniref:Transcriptional regulator lsrR n=1 Tax=Raoultella terrigena TaxID=577 RepID=A0A4U9D3T6_RAOTE|nr:Transcriptional regulator lsrR [Raoultella terrigena]
MSEKRITEESRYAGLALAEEELVARVAWCYYHDGLTQNDIGERLGLPRLKISRLLEKGRQSGVIRVQINSRYEGCLALETELQRRFDLKIARVLPALNTPPMNTRLGIGAAQSLMGVLAPGQLLAVGFRRGDHELPAASERLYQLSAGAAGDPFRRRGPLHDRDRPAGRRL